MPCDNDVGIEAVQASVSLGSLWHRLERDSSVMALVVNVSASRRNTVSETFILLRKHDIVEC